MTTSQPGNCCPLPDLCKLIGIDEKSVREAVTIGMFVDFLKSFLSYSEAKLFRQFTSTRSTFRFVCHQLIDSSYSLKINVISLCCRGPLNLRSDYGDRNPLLPDQRDPSQKSESDGLIWTRKNMKSQQHQFVGEIAVRISKIGHGQSLILVGKMFGGGGGGGRG